MRRALLPHQLQTMRNHGQASCCMCYRHPHLFSRSQHLCVAETRTKIFLDAFLPRFRGKHTVAGRKALHQGITLLDMLREGCDKGPVRINGLRCDMK